MAHLRKHTISILIVVIVCQFRIACHVCRNLPAYKRQHVRILSGPNHWADSNFLGTHQREWM